MCPILDHDRLKALPPKKILTAQFDIIAFGVLQFPLKIVNARSNYHDECAGAHGRGSCPMAWCVLVGVIAMLAGKGRGRC
jgi:hypothetical protein